MLSAKNTFLANPNILNVEPNPQNACSLLRRLPAEVRARIWACALTDYPDPSPEAEFERTISWTRPGYTSPCRTDTDLLQTCRLIYRETWYLPFYYHEYVGWLTHKRFTPMDQGKLEYRTRKIRRLLQISEHSSKGHRTLEISNMRFFAQASLVDAGAVGRRLRAVIPLVHPRTLTLTIRHWDWELWEAEERPLHLDGRWISQVCRLLPPSLTEVHVEVESVEREASQVRELATQMKNRWVFSRRDGVRLFAGHIEEGRWRGPSMWNKTRCYGDETEPGAIDYYMLVVIFQTESVLQKCGVSISPYASRLVQQATVCPCKLELKSTLPVKDRGPVWKFSLALDDQGSTLNVPSPHWKQPLRPFLPGNSQPIDVKDVDAPCDCGKPRVRLWHRKESAVQIQQVAHE